MMVTQQMNYEYYHLCRNTRDLDISAAQLLAIHVGPTQFLCQVLDSFGLWPFFFSEQYQGEFSNPDDADKLIRLAESMMRLLIVTVTEIPIASYLMSGIKSADRSGERWCTSWQLDHALQRAPRLQVSSGVPRNATCSTDEVEKTLGAIATIRTGHDLDMEATKYTLKEECWNEYDPTFYHIPDDKHEVATESYMLKRKMCQVCAEKIEGCAELAKELRACCVRKGNNFV